MTNYTPTDAGTSIGSESLTRVFSALANPRRRRALHYLERHRELSLATLADEVAEREADVPLREIDEETVKTVYLSLYHTHVPKLEDAGIVAYDQESDWITRRDTRRCELALSLMDSTPNPIGVE
jgi:DNA-binding transcriptional ArsR family regulator